MSLCNTSINSCNYILAIRQVYCQGGTQRTIDNVYTNVANGTEFPLRYGYTLTYLSGNPKHAVVQLSNDVFIPSISFTIPNGNYKVFDVPAQTCSYKIYVAARINCNNPCQNS